MLRFFGVLFLLAVIALILGQVQGWWNFSSVNAEGKTGVSFNVDKDKIKQDTGALAEKAKQAFAKLRDSSSSGKVSAVDALQSKLTVKIGDDDHVLDVPATLAITLDGAASSLAQLAVGDKVSLTLDKSGVPTKLAASRK